MAVCDSTVLTGQEGLIQFKPLGTTNCIDDFCPFAGERIYLPCSADYSIDDCIEFEKVGILDGSGVQDEDGDYLGESEKSYWITATGVGAAGDVDSCNNSVEGIPYIVVSTTKGDPTGNVTWDLSDAGTVVTTGALVIGRMLEVNLTGGTGYSNGTFNDIAIQGGSGSGALATVIVTGGSVASVEVTTGGSGYTATDTGLTIVPGNGLTFTPGTAASFDLDAGDVHNISEPSGDGTYVISLCDFQTVCGVRDFSIDLSRDELDVTTLPCSVGESCGKQLAAFKKTQAGFATATGTLTVYFTCDQTSLQNKLIQGSLQRVQGGATIRLYVCTKTDQNGNIIDADSLFIEADVQLLGLSFAVNPDDPTNATINFGVTDVKSAFGLS